MHIPACGRLAIYGSVALLCACSDGGSQATTDLSEARCVEAAPAGAIATPVRRGAVCALLGFVACIVDDPAAAADGNLGTATSISYSVGLLDGLLGGAAGVAVELPGRLSGGSLAAFEIAFPASLVQASVAKQITVTTFLNGQAVESAGFGEGTELDLLGLSILGDQRREIVGFVASSPFNGVELTASSSILSLDLGSGINVLDFCSRASP